MSRLLSTGSQAHSYVHPTSPSVIDPLNAKIMLAVAWATLPDLPTYRTGVIMVGLARYA